MTEDAFSYAAKSPNFQRRELERGVVYNEPPAEPVKEPDTLLGRIREKAPSMSPRRKVRLQALLLLACIVPSALAWLMVKLWGPTSAIGDLAFLTFLVTCVILQTLAPIGLIKLSRAIWTGK